MIELPLPREGIARLIPHAGTMVLLDRLDAFDAKGLSCTSWSHRLPDNPLRRDGALGALCGIEYAGQAMALHGTLLGTGGKPRRGFLASVRDVRLGCATLDDIEEALTIDVAALAVETNHVLYEFKLAAAKACLLSGRAAVFLEEVP